MSSGPSLIGSPEDVAAFGEQLTYLCNLDPPVYVLGSIGRLAIDVDHGGRHIESLEVRKPWPADELAYNQAAANRSWWRRAPKLPPRAIWRDNDVAAPFAKDFYATYGDPSVRGIPVDLHLHRFFATIDGHPYWRPTMGEMIALSETALKPFIRDLDGYPVRTFSAAVQEWMEVGFAQRFRFYSRDKEPSYKGFAELMKRLRDDPENYHAELELPAELTPR